MREDHTFQGSDGSFHYIDWGGSGPLTHFSHATGLCAGLYTPLAEKLSSHLHVVGMDDRGHGKTGALTNTRKLKNWDIFAEDQEHFFRYLSEPMIAMGHSRGAVASMILAIKRPALIRALILIDPTILPLSWMWWWFLLKKLGLARLVPIAYKATRRKAIWPDKKAILDAYRSKGMFAHWKEGFLESYIADGTEETEDGNIRLSCDPIWESRCFASCPHDIWRYIPLLRTPCLFLYGLKSDICLKPTIRRFERLVPGATLHGFENTTHFVPMERPDECVEAILDFLKDHGIL